MRFYRNHLKMFSCSTILSVLAPVLILSAQGCGNQRHQASSLQNVFGDDNRVAMDRHLRPWTAIGKIFDTGCTGTMIGRDLVLTAAHCVVDPATSQISTNLTWFRADYVSGTTPAESWIERIWPGTFQPQTDRGRDWAIIQLRDPIGDQVGWFDVNFTDANNFPDVLTVAGYSIDFNNAEIAGIDFNCRMQARFPDQNEIFHDCDTARGSSGGPAFAEFSGAYYIVGVNVAEKRDGGEVSLRLADYDHDHANVLIPTLGFFDQAKQMQVLSLSR